MTDRQLSALGKEAGPSAGVDACASDSWYLAQCKAGQEHIAAASLVQRGLAKTFFPREGRSRRWRGRLQLLLAPVFPSYLFLSPGADPDWRAIRTIRGLTRLVSFGTGEPAPVPLEVVRELRHRCDEAGVLRPPDDLGPGEKVLILDGAFADLVATIEAIAPDTRVTLLLDLLGRETRLIATGSAGLRRTC